MKNEIYRFYAQQILSCLWRIHLYGASFARFVHDATAMAIIRYFQVRELFVYLFLFLMQSRGIFEPQKNAIFFFVNGEHIFFTELGNLFLFGA